MSDTSSESESSSPSDSSGVHGPTDLERVGQFRDGPYDLTVLKQSEAKQSWYERGWGREKEDFSDKEPYPLIPGPKSKAATNDWTFEKRYLSLYKNDPYVEPNIFERQLAKDDEEKNISDEAFISTFPISRARDALYSTKLPIGAFNTEELKKELADDRLKGVPNFITKPGKKGSGFGYLDITIGAYPEYIHEPFLDVIELQRKAEAEAREKMMDFDEIFYPPGHAHDFFDPNPYLDSEDPDGEEETYNFDFGKSSDESDDEGKPPWIPNSHTKVINGNKDVVSPLEKFPKYKPADEYETPIQNVVRDDVKKDRSKPGWAPHHFSNRSRQTKSTIDYNVKVRVNAGNFHRF